MRLRCALILLAACSGNSGGSDGNAGDAPNPGTPLADRLTVTTITAPDSVIGGGANYRIWGTGNLKVGRVFTVPYADCGTLVGFTTGTAQSPEARVARLDATDQLSTTHDLGAFELRGLAAEPDGHFAALLWDHTAMSLHVQRFDVTGAPGWSTSLDDTVGQPTDFNIGESRLEFGNGNYEAYFHVHGISGIFMGHEGDALHTLAAATGANSTNWQWGCSHSMSELLRYDAAANAILPICVTDCYPGTSGSNFATDSIGGVYVENSTKVLDVDGGCNGSVAGELGGAAPAAAGWKLVFNAHQNAATHGQSSYVAATMNQDIGFASIAMAKTPSPVVWLTTSSGNEANATIARWQPNGDASEQYVVGWSDGTGYQLARVSDAGAFLEGPAATTAKWGERDDPFRTHVNADVVWSWFDAAAATSFHFARLHAGSSAVCAPL
jgi:hypothetical protein